MSEVVAEKKQPSKRKKALIITGVVFLVAGLIAFFLWLGYFRFHKYTNDAYVEGNLVQVTPQVTGIITSINVNDTDFVKKDQVLVSLDTTDHELNLKNAEANLANTVRSVVDLFQNVETKSALVAEADANLLNEELYYEKRVGLVDIGGVSKEAFQGVETGLLKAKAALEAARSERSAAVALVEGTTLETHPRVKEMITEVKKAFVALKRCQIVAPTDGFIAERTVQLGEYVNAGTALLSIVPLDQIWVNANYKETKLSKMRVGQNVKLTSDMYGSSVVYHGRVVGLNPGTGNAFSILPPQNATGNWIKIVQRVPVRVSLNVEELETHPLWLGLTMESWVDVKDTSLPRLQAGKPKLKPIYKTDVYAKQIRGAEQLVKKIIRDNS